MSIIMCKNKDIKKVYSITLYFQKRYIKNLCTICYESNSFDIINTKCNHIFHNKCLIKWCKISNTCPVCRVEDPLEIKKDNEESYDYESYFM